MVSTVFEAEKKQDFPAHRAQKAKYIFIDHQANIYNQYYFVLKSSLGHCTIFLYKTTYYCVLTWVS